MLHLFTELKENPESLKTANSTAVVKKFLIDLCLVAGRGILKCNKPKDLKVAKEDQRSIGLMLNRLDGQ